MTNNSKISNTTKNFKQATGSRENTLVFNDFREYILLQYKDNPEQTSILNQWLDQFEANPHLYVEKISISNAQNDLAIHGFAVNGQIIFSKDINVLTVPYPRSSQDAAEQIYNDQLVGVWVHNFEVDQDFTASCEMRAQESMERTCTEHRVADADDTMKPQLKRILKNIQEIGHNHNLPGGKANIVPDGAIRFHGPDNGAGCSTIMHRDMGPAADPGEAHHWTRTILHPFKGKGTFYALDGKDSPIIDDPIGASISMPLGMTYSHCAFAYDRNQLDEDFQKWGIRHSPPLETGKEGRAAFIKPIDCCLLEPITDVPSPWIINQVDINYELEEKLATKTGPLSLGLKT